MKIKLFEIINSMDILQTLVEQKFSAKTAYRIQRNLRIIQPELEQFEAQRRKIIEEYGKENKENNNEFIIPEKDIEKVNKELNELLQEEIELNIIKININDLNCEITPGNLMRIEWMIDEMSI